MSVESESDFNINVSNWSPKLGKETNDFLEQSGMPNDAKKNY